jgi:hypothetical protein
MRKHIKSAWHRVGWLGLSIIFLTSSCLLMGMYLLQSSTVSYEEISQIKSGVSFKDLSVFFANIANKKGAPYAFEILKRAPLPPGIDVHLLGHIVGDILYKQQGAKGILVCDQDFRNACSHTIVIGTLLEKGPDSLAEIAELCKQAPGGTGAYTMCFHGLGHGVLAYNDYELPLAVKMCEKAGLGGASGREAIECVGGTIMEMIAGVHDREMWQEKVKKYFKKNDPLFPCDASFMPEAMKGMCYTYLTPHLFQAAGADLGHPLPSQFKEAFTYCEPLKGEDRKACFAGFGKEFIVLAQNRDIRKIDQMTSAQAATVLDWCYLALPADGRKHCVLSALGSMLWGGENDPKAAVQFCGLADSRMKNSDCLNELFSEVKFYIQDTSRREYICNVMEGDRKTLCQQKLLSL